MLESLGFSNGLIITLVFNKDERQRAHCHYGARFDGHVSHRDPWAAVSRCSQSDRLSPVVWAHCSHLALEYRVLDHHLYEAAWVISTTERNAKARSRKMKG